MKVNTYYPENPPKDFNEWMRGIVCLAEQARHVRYNERELEARANALARSFGRTKDRQDQGLNQN